MPKRGILDRLRSDSLAFFDLQVGTLQLRVGAVENVRDQARIVPSVPEDVLMGVDDHGCPS